MMSISDLFSGGGQQNIVLAMWKAVFLKLHISLVFLCWNYSSPVIEIVLKRVV